MTTRIDDHSSDSGAAAGSAANIGDPQPIIDTVTKIFDMEKGHRLGSTEELYAPIKVFFFHEDQITVLCDTIFEWADIDERNEYEVAVGMLNMALELRAIATLSEGWTASRCASCGMECTDGVCEQCDEPLCNLAKNPYRQELLSATLRFCGSKLSSGGQTQPVAGR